MFNPALQVADHAQPVIYEMAPRPPRTESRIDVKNLYIHQPRGRRSRALDDSIERFVDETRLGTG